TLVVENAEILAGITMTQVLNPGLPVCYGGIPHIMDMKTTMISFGAPEQGLMAVAMTQIAKHYRLPVYINVGIGDSKRVDAQTGLERGMTLLMGALAGADTFGHMGICGADQGASLEQLIVDDRMAAYVKRVLRSFQVTPQTLALEVIKKIGIGGSYLADEHTVQHFRQELWSAEGFDRRGWDDWCNDGKPTMADWARQRKEQILANHKPEPLDPKLAGEIDKIVKSATKKLVKD
ncbi:MAG: trimethylamine methyltransferase family protein, partial [Planctomycetota bacterium]